MDIIGPRVLRQLIVFAECDVLMDIDNGLGSILWLMHGV